MYQVARDKPAVLFVVRYLNPDLFGGIPRKILLIAEWLKTHDVLLPVLLTSHDTGLFVQTWRAMALPVHVVDMAGRGALKRTRAAAEELLAIYSVKLIQTHRLWDSMVGRRLRKAHPHLRHLFRVHTHIQSSHRSRFRKAAYHLMDWWTATYVDRFCVLTNVVRDELIRRSHVPADKISLVRNGVPALGQRLAPACNGSRIVPRLAVLADVQTGKRQDLAVRALGRLKKRGIRAELRLIGPEREGFGDEVRQVAARLGVADQVEFTGYTDNVYEALEGIEVVALPSDSEGIPTSMIEAMSVAKIGIATPVGGTRDLIENRTNGFIMDKGDWRMLADILFELFTTPSQQWDQLRQAGYETWQEGFSLKVMMKGILTEYVKMGVVSEECLGQCFPPEERCRG